MMDPMTTGFLALYGLCLFLCYKADRKVQRMNKDHRRLSQKMFVISEENRALRNENGYLQRRLVNVLDRKK